MSKASIRNLWATPIYQSSVDIDEESVNVLTKQPMNIKGHLYTSFNADALDLLPNLKEQVMNHCLTYLYDVFKIDKKHKFRITSSWINRIDHGQYAPPHQHGNSLISGVLYFNNKEASEIGFEYTNSILSECFEFTYTEDTPYNNSLIWTKPENNTILLFPSNLRHMVQFNDSDHPRWSLAFNIFPYGIINDDTQVRLSL
jgi:uncharacterized protein (TIGR02466 family)